MVNCDRCDASFEDAQALHLHWGAAHADDLTSHEQEQVKKARRQQEQSAQQRAEALARRKKLAGYGLAAVLVLGVVAALGSQVLSVSVASGGTANLTGFALEQQPVLGDADAPVTVVEFGDYRCPACRHFDEAVMPQLRSQYIDTGKVRFAFINFPFLGPGSTQAALAGECVLRQDRDAFWGFHHALYDRQGAESGEWVTTDLLVETATGASDAVNGQELRQCITQRETMDAVRTDRSVGQDSRVSATPTVFVDGQQVPRATFSQISQAIDRALD